MVLDAHGLIYASLGPWFSTSLGDLAVSINLELLRVGVLIIGASLLGSLLGPLIFGNSHMRVGRWGFRET